MREFELTCLGVYLHQLHLYLVALFDACLFHCFQSFPVNLRDVQQAVFAGHELHKATVCLDRAYHTVIHFAHLGYSHDGTYLGECSLNAILVGSTYLHLAHTVGLVNHDGGTSIFLHLLDNLSTRTNHGTDKLLGYLYLHNAWHVGFQFGTWLGDGFGEFRKDVLSALFCLHQCLFKNFKTQSVALDVHLRGGKTVFGTCGLEVHISQVVFISQDITQHGILVFSGVFDKSHSNTAHGLLHRHTCIHQGQGACAYGGHRRRAVALQYLRHQTHGVGEVFGYLTLQSAPCQMAMTYLSATHSTLCLGLTGAEWREVIVQQEAHVALLQHIINHLLIQFGAQRTGRKALCLTTCKDRASVRHGQRRHLAPYRANLVGLSAVKTDALVKDTAAHSIAHHIVVVALHHGSLFLLLIFSQVGMCCKVSLLEVGKNLVKSILAGLLVQSLLGYIISGLIELLVHLCTQVFIVYLVVVFTLHVLAQFLAQFGLQQAHGLDGFHGGLEGSNHILLAHLFHLAFHHHDILGRGSHHDVHIGICHLLEGGVDDILAIDACHTHFADGALKGDI